MNSIFGSFPPFSQARSYSQPKQVPIRAPIYQVFGHTVSRAGIAPQTVKVSAVAKYPTPTSLDESRRFLGMLNFYNRFIPRAASIITQLYAGTARKSKPADFQWTNELDQAFKKTKAALANTMLLWHPRMNSKIAIVTDASAVAIGAVLQQRAPEGGPWEPLAYTLARNCERPISNTVHLTVNCYGLYLGIRHFRHFLEGQDFPAFTDHRPLTFAMARVSEPWSARQYRHLEYSIAQYTTDIQHVAGADNTIVDTLSWVVINELRRGVDYSRMVDIQQVSPKTHAYRTMVTDLKWGDAPILYTLGKNTISVQSALKRPELRRNQVNSCYFLQVTKFRGHKSYQ